MYTILGKGFGLYGYLPAIILNNCNLVLSKEYKLNIQKRKDINIYINRIKWTESIGEAINLSNNVILAIPPKEQFKFLHKNETNIANKTMFLEKPIAASPKESLILLKIIEKKKIRFYVNYSFIYLDWFKKLYSKINYLKPDAIVKITWKFKAHFLKTNVMNWKSNFELGGGILRFYGIHLIAVLTALNYENCKIIKFKNDSKFIIYKFINANKAAIEIAINIDSKTDKFAINIFDSNTKNNVTLIDTKDPFDSPKNMKLITLDRRIETLRTYLIEKNNSIQSLMFNKKVVKLWSEIESD